MFSAMLIKAAAFILPIATAAQAQCPPNFYTQADIEEYQRTCLNQRQAVPVCVGLRTNRW